MYIYMSFSIRNYLQSYNGKQLSKTDFEKLGEEIEIESHKRYAKNSALDVISRYAAVYDGCIKIDTTKRTINMTYAKIVNILETAVSESVNNNIENNYDDTDPLEIKGQIMMDNKIDRTRLEQVERLMNIEFPKQRSKEWFELREKMITASDGGTVLGFNPYEKPYEFVLKKVFGKPFLTSLDCYHGKKYENIATLIYSQRMNVGVEEFGLCQHPIHKFLGASPDGIVGKFQLDKIHPTNLVGRMLEIKCPMRRKILMDKNAPEVYGIYEEIKDLKTDVKKGICPTYYWVQIQLQLQCCQLDECDFIQCEISEYSTREEFLNDSYTGVPWKSLSTGHEKGVVIQLMPVEQINGETNYEQNLWNVGEFIYPPKIDMTRAELDEWTISALSGVKYTHPDRVVDDILYWKLDKIRIITIKRDDEWFNKNLASFKQMWNCVVCLRENKEKANAVKAYIDKLDRKQNANIMTMINNIVTQKN